MKSLFIGGIKSGKSINAQNYAKKHAKEKPIYLATTEFLDEGMKKRIKKHKQNRKDDFITIEESLKLNKTISTCQDIVLVECVGMWINNMLFHNFTYKDIKKEIKKVMKQNKDIVFVINDVGSTLLPPNKVAATFADINGKISQIIASGCDEVFHTIAGISTKIK
jgi:adenosylcobinamide kinase/adenosylcobinamide-phosphate guanylyltransferase